MEIWSFRVSHTYSNSVTGADAEWRYEMELQKLKEITAGILNISVDMITEKSSFYDDLGADSLDLFQILTTMEDTFDVDIAEKGLEYFHTVGDAARALAAAR